MHLMILDKGQDTREAISPFCIDNMKLLAVVIDQTYIHAYECTFKQCIAYFIFSTVDLSNGLEESTGRFVDAWMYVCVYML